MSNGAKTTIVVIVILIIAGGIWYSYKHAANAPAVDNGTYSATPQTGEETTVTSTTTTTTTSPSDDSNAALNQDMSNVNTQMNGLNSDSASANDSANQ